MMIFCTDCGDYETAPDDILNEYLKSISHCHCQIMYPMNMKIITETVAQDAYNQMYSVLQELKTEFVKKDMKKMTEMVIGVKTKSEICWMCK